MNLGFSYVGLIYLLMLFIPNIIWSKNQPKDYDKYVKNENKVLLVFERIGEVSLTVLSLIFTDFNINKISYWSIILLVSFLSMIIYEISWIRYFKLGIYGRNIFMIIASIIMAIGHIGIHLNHRKEIK